MSRVIVITGPTAVGKTKLSIELAKKLNGEIINADAMQVYKGLNIGTAKVTEKEKENIPHHLFDIKEVEEEYSIYNYQKDCRKVIDDILRRNKTPILVGGTGLYIKAALYDYKLSEEKTNNTYDNLKTEEIYKELLKLDKDINIDKNNRRRLIRALNYYKENNTSISNNKTNKLLYDTIFIGLTTDREILYKKITFFPHSAASFTCGIINVSKSLDDSHTNKSSKFISLIFLSEITIPVFSPPYAYAASFPCNP